MKTVLYLIQASAGLPKRYECLKTRSYLLLSYKEDTSDTTIYAPNTTWTGGRNRLYQYVKDNNLLYDYYVFMDEDVVLKKAKSILIPNLSAAQRYLLDGAYTNIASGSMRSKWPLRALFNRYSYQQPEEQEAGFESFEESLKLGYPIATMNHYRRFNWPLQTATMVDCCFIALHQEVFFSNTVIPYTEKYDADSWHLASFIFWKKAFHYYPEQIMQNNQYTIINTQGSDYPKMELTEHILMEVYAEACYAELGDKVPISKSKEIKAHLPLKQVEGRFMSRFGFFIKFILPAIIFKYANKLRAEK